MIQYNETTFSDPMEYSEAIQKFTSLITEGKPVMALHIGDDFELQRRKELLIKQCNLQSQIDDIKEELKVLNSKPISKIIHIPSEDDIKNFQK